MPDLTAGTTVRALDTPPTVSDEEPGFFSFNQTTYGIDADAGTYNDCGVAFTAPTSGRVLILFRADIRLTSGGLCAVCPVVRLGSTVGSGAIIVAASDDKALYNVVAAANPDTRGSHNFVSGLTPGTVYNVRLEHVTSGVGNLGRRGVTVVPLP